MLLNDEVVFIEAGIELRVGLLVYTLPLFEPVSLHKCEDMLSRYKGLDIVLANVCLSMDASKNRNYCTRPNRRV